MAAETRSNYYCYIISTCSLLIPDRDPIQISEDKILGLTIEKDFDNDYFPVFDLQLSLDANLYYTIIDNRTTVKFKIRLERYAYTDNLTLTYKDVIFDTIFSTFIDDDATFLDKDLFKQTQDLLGTNENRVKYDFYLFKDADITASRKIMNRVLTSSTLTDCVVYMLSKTGSTNLLMTPLDNTGVYNEILLPPLTVPKSISYLDKQYGFYNHGLLFFYDFDTTYFINKRAECTAYRTGEYKDVITQVFKTLNPNSKTPGNYKDTETKSYTLHVSHDNTDLITTSLYDEQISGKNINIINTVTNTTNTVDPKIQSRSSTTKSVVNNLDNKFLPKMIENMKYENDHIVNMNVYDVDLHCFTPNKKFILSFEDKEVNINHKGNYRLAYSLFTFTKNGNYFVVAGTVQLKKTT